MSAFVQSAQDHSGSATPRPQTAGSITVTAGNALIIWIFTLNGGSQTVSGNGNTYTYIGTSPNFSNFLSAYYCQNANSGATAVATSDTGAFALIVQEESGLATSGGLAGAIVFNDQASPGTVANTLTSTACNVTTAPATVFAIAVDVAGVQSAAANTGNMNAGTTLAWNSRVTGWATAGVVTAIAEDIEVLTAGNVTATASVTGNKGFASFVTAAFALPEPTVIPNPPVLPQGPMPRRIFILP